MAIRRTDTPLATTSDPKAIDPVVAKSQSTDPDTGVTTYKHTWSNTYGRKSAAPTTRTTTPLVKRTTTPERKTSSTPVKKESSSSLKVPQERTFTSLPKLTPAGTTVDTKPIAPMPKLRESSNQELKKNAEEQEKIKKRRIYSENEHKSYDNYVKDPTKGFQKPGLSFDQWNNAEKERAQKNSAKNRRWDWLKGDGGNSAQREKAVKCTSGC